MKRYSILVIVSVFFLLWGPYYTVAQVNIETIRNTVRQDGFSTQFKGSLSSFSGNLDLFVVKSDFRLDYLAPDFNGFFITKLETKELDDALFMDKKFYHLRGIWQSIKPGIFVELFTQLEHDKALRITERHLFGAGLRFKCPISDPQLSMYLGTGIMREYEDYTDQTTVSVYRYRMTQYLSHKWKPKDTIQWIGTLYYQPVLKDWASYRVLLDQQLLVQLTTHVSLSTDLVYRYDSTPLSGLKRADLEISQGLQFNF